MRRACLISFALAITLVAGLAAVVPQPEAQAHASTTQQTLHPQIPLCIPDPNGSGSCASPCQLSPSTANCNGKDPQNTHCSEDGVTVHSIALFDIDTGQQNGLIEMRWSNTCQTNWTRTTMYYPNWRSTNIVAKMVCGYESTSPCISPKSYSTSCNPSFGVGGGSGYCPITSPNYGVWSPMIYAPGAVETCGEVDDSLSPAVLYFGGWANPGYTAGSASCAQGTSHTQLP